MQYTLKLILLNICVFFFSFSLWSQSPPEAINYQAVARSLAGIPLVNQSVTVDFSILQGSSSGTVVYSETHNKTTNQFGLFTAEIGLGAVNSGIFSAINWGNSIFFLQVTVNGEIMPATQLLSVPYALHAKTANTGVPGADGHNSLINSTIEPPGVNCANGGYFIQSWLDLDDDGAISSGETPLSYYICNGVDGTNGLNGADGVGIDSTFHNADGTLTIFYSDNTTFTTADITGPAGPAGTTYYPGNGITFNADTIVNTGDADSDPNNELQVISISNDTIFLSNGGSYVVLPSSSADSDWSQGAGVVYNTSDYVGIGTSTPFFALDVVSTGTVLAAFRGNNPNYSAVSVANSNPNADVGFILLSGADTAIFGLNPTQKLLVLDNSTSGGHIGLNADSSVFSYAEVVGSMANKMIYNQTNSIYNQTDSIFSFSPTGTIVNVNQGMFLTDSLYVLGSNAFNPNWVLANDGIGQAVWKDPTTLGLGGSLWQQNSPNIYFNTGNVGIGNTNPTSPLTITSAVGNDIEFTGGFNADISSSAQLRLNSFGSTSLNASQLFLQTSNTDRLVILNNGNVGIGISSPAVELDVNGETQSNDVRVLNNFIFNASGNTGPNYILMDDGTGTGNAVWNHKDSLGISAPIWNQGTGDVYTSTDSVGIGVANPIAPLHVSGGGITSPIALFEKGGFFNAMIDINSTSSNGSGINFKNGAALTGSITSSTTNLMNINATNVAIGTGNAFGKLQVNSSSSASNPTLQLHETSTGYSRIKHTNTVAGGKYWITEAGINAVDANSGYSIAYYDGSNTKIPFIVYGDNKVGVNNLNAPLGIFHVMDNNGSYSIFEGMNQPGEIKVARSNQPSFTRQAILGGEMIGNVTFAGATGTTFGSGPQITARATENFSGSNNGSELIFKTISNGSTAHQDALRLLNDGTVEIPINLRLLNGAGTAGQVLTSDALGNATWQSVSAAANDTSILDADGDTYINLESAPDQDVIHFNLGNNAGYPAAEYFTMIGPRLEVINSGNSVFIGAGAGRLDDLTNNNNTYLGFQSGYSSSTGISNTAIGESALRNSNGSNNTVVGRRGLFNATSGDNNTVFGATALYNSTTSSGNNAFGASSLYSNTTGGVNTAIGDYALYSNTTASYNVGLGTNALRFNVVGAQNTGLGIESLKNSTGDNNTSVGYASGFSLTSGDFNTFIGANADAAAPNLTNATAIGANARVGVSNAIVLGKNAKVGIGMQNPNYLFHIQDSLASVGTVLLQVENNIGVPVVSVTNDKRLDVYGNFLLNDGSQGVGNVLTSVDAAGNAKWKPKNIAFEARASTNQMVDNTPSLLQFDALGFDDGGNFDPSSGNYRFNCPISGVYKFDASVLFDYSSAGPNDLTVVEILINGNPLYKTTAPIQNAERLTNVNSATVRLSAGDAVQVRVYTMFGGSTIMTGAADEVWFSGHLVYAY